MADKHPAQPKRPKKDDETLYGDVVFDPDASGRYSPKARAAIEALAKRIKRRPAPTKENDGTPSEDLPRRP